jgi:7-cyano-7-deazaguanine synthase in queuosine biosynthesis
MQGSKLYPDTSLEYISSLENLIRDGLEEKNFMIHMPFYGLSKDEILSMYLNRIDLNKVFSCTNPIGNDYCNKCYKCKKLNKLKERIK